MKQLLTLLFLCAFCSMQMGLFAQDNMLLNGDFETGVKNAEWFGFNWDVDTVGVYEGSYCARTQTNFEGDAAINYALPLTFPDTTLYHFGAFIRAVNPAKVCNIRIQYKTPAGNAWNILWTSPLNDTNWVFVDTMFAFPATATQARINMYQPSSGKFYLDSVFFMLADTTSTDTTGGDTTNTSIAHFINSNKIDIYPNPAQDQLIVANQFNESVQMSLLDLQGRTVLSEQINPAQNTLKLADLPRGLYIISFRMKDGAMIYRHKILLE
ncbi:MAG: T9SS type A sorting domain-containing protein [Bacteroidia bacterium]